MGLANMLPPEKKVESAAVTVQNTLTRSIEPKLDSAVIGKLSILKSQVIMHIYRDWNSTRRYSNPSLN